MAGLAALGLIVAPAYSLILVQRAFHGEPLEKHRMRDLGAREMATLVVLVVATVGMGLYPQPLIQLADARLRGNPEPAVAGAGP